MKKGLFAIIMALSCASVCFAGTDELPKTKIESALLRSGIIYKKQFIKLGDVENVEFKGVLLSDRNDIITEKGLVIEVPGYGRSATVWLDPDEINDLLAAVDYMIKASKALEGKPLTNYTEVIYSTKDGLRLGFYCEKSKTVKDDNLKMFVTCGKIQSVTKTMDIKHLEEFKQLVSKGLDVLK